MRLHTVPLICLTVAATLLADPLRAAPLSVAQRQEDPTLSKRVTLVSQRIYLGDLLEQLSKQSGVALGVGTLDGSGDVQVAVSVHDTPLADVLDGLWSLVSYKDADWDWQRDGTPGHYRYRLRQPDAAHFLADRLKRQIQEDFAAQTQKMLSGLRMTQADLQGAAKQDPLLASLADGRDDRVRPEMEIFAGLPPDLQRNILENQQAAVIPVTQLSPAAREFVHQQWLWSRDHGGMTRDKDGTLIPVREPQQIGISAHRVGSDFAPGLSVDCGFGGGILFGGEWMENDWNAKMAALWRRPGDAAGDARETQTVPTLSGRTPPAPSERPLAMHVTEMGTAAPLAVLARLPDERGGSSSVGGLSPAGKTVRAYLDRLGDIHFQHKWRGGVLLITDPSWFLHADDGTAAPWEDVKALRDAEAAAPDGFLPLRAMMHAAYQMNAAQLAATGEWLPVAGHAATWHDLLRLMDNSPELLAAIQSPEGSTRTDALRAASATLHIDAQVEDGTAKRVRLVQTQYGGAKPMREMTVEVLGADGARLTGLGFDYFPRQFRSGAEQPADRSAVAGRG